MNEIPTRQILDDLDEIVAIPSVYSAPQEGAPYGIACKQALEWFVAKAKSYGLKAENIDNYCAYAEVGEGKECVGVLAHLDVVPAGGGWSTDPFKMVVDGGKVYGRGVGDDKGPVVVCLHALKSLKDGGTKLKRRVRLIVGADEERGSSCIRHYLEVGGEVPVMSFVPDSEFPIINSEKGIAHIEFIFDDEALCKNVGFISGAECKNALPDRSTVKVIKGSALEAAIKSACGGNVNATLFSRQPAASSVVACKAKPDDFEITCRDGITISAVGTAEHASTPEKGDSALWKILGILAAFNGAIGSKHIQNIFDKMCADDASAKLGIDFKDERSGDLTMCMSEARIVGGTLCLTVDFRLPIGVTAEKVKDNICKALNCRAEILDYHENLYIDPDSPLIKELLDVYVKATGDTTGPLQVGGGTYARELPNAVAFGSTPLGLDINMHRADENFPIEQLFKNYEIYLAAMVRLANL